MLHQGIETNLLHISICVVWDAIFECEVVTYLIGVWWWGGEGAQWIPCGSRLWTLSFQLRSSLGVTERAKPHGGSVEIEVPQCEYLFTSVSTYLTQLINLCTWVEQHSLSHSFSFSQLITITKGKLKHIKLKLMNRWNDRVTGRLSHLKGSKSISADTSSQIHPVALYSNLIMDPFKLR